MKRFPSTRLSEQQIKRYRDNGFTTLPSVLGKPQIQALRAEFRRLWTSLASGDTSTRLQRRHTISGETVADRIDPVLDISPILQGVARDESIVGPVSDLIRVGPPEIFKAKIISKWSRTLGYKMHQDYGYWSRLADTTPDDFVTAVIAVDYFDDKSGTIEFFPGLHRTRLPPAAENSHDVDESSMDLSRGILVDLAPGDMLLFHSLIPHRSGPNLSPRNRESLFITYVSAGYGYLGDLYYSARPSDFIDPA